MTDDAAKQAPSLIGIGNQSLVDRARALGLTWTLRPATVVQSSSSGVLVGIPGAFITDVLVTYDGDSVILPTINLTGSILPVGARVMGLLIPPSGNYIVGQLELSGAGGGLMARTDADTNSPAVSSETVVLQTGQARWLPNRAYRWSWGGQLSSSVANLVIGRIYVDGVLVQANLNYFQAQLANEWRFGSNYFAVEEERFSDVQMSLQASSGTVVMIGNSDSRRYVDAYDVGPKSLFPSIKTI